MNNPDIINLGTAENRLIDDLILPLLQHRPDETMYHTTYAAAANQTSTKTAVAEFYKDWLGIDATPEQLLFGSGIAFLVERLGLCLCEEGDIVLIPKPCYGAFEPDLQMCKAKVVYIDLSNLPPTPPENSKLLILTNPGNPIGTKIENIDALLKWAYQIPDLHIVTDDVYAMSNRTGEKYQSIAGRPDADPMRVHQFYGVSKDWALAGLHVGFFWTKNEELMNMMKLAVGVWTLSSDTQWVIWKIFENKERRDNIITTFKKRLTEAQAVVTEKLKEEGIPAKTYDNSLFAMIDLTNLVNGSIDEELRVWRELLYKYRVHILPGAAGFHVDEPGWFRLCFSFPTDKLVDAIGRISHGIKEMKAAQEH